MLYELTGQGMKRIDTPENHAKNSLAIGTVLHLNGYNEPDYVIVKNLRIDTSYGARYLKVSLEDYGQSQCNAFELKYMSEKKDNRIQLYITGKVLGPDEVLSIWEKSENKRKVMAAAQEKAQEEADRLEAAGRELFKRHIPEDAKALIIAERHQDESDLMTDYFAHRTEETVILDFSRHTRDDFKEMRKYAGKIQETKHLGPSCGHFEPRVVMGADFQSNGAYYHEGAYSHWHRELTEKNGGQVVFKTKAEAEAYILEKGQPEPITFDGNLIPFKWVIEEEEIEHREKYSMGAGYYLKDGYGNSSGWAIKKVRKYRDDWSREYYIAMAKRCVF